ncbi:HAD family hydrolase [Secundilactobacillus folii]|uniref:Cof-type HAD-IIB family hydrolase n=1 Tax=Secundilactobacillus folii TaxID=2678357 RepID=A0A7X2XW11_9LACO|nr:HAD family hydrolase [Secundilactobacillus folii]MTV82714.1 Cof-type HAD-IIB family hydrolase [Secundilactobacillus folii]
MTIKHIFSDMDGTLLNDQGVVSAGNQSTIISSGIPFTLVSARSPKQMLAAIQALKLTTPQVGFNGGVIYRVENGEFKVIHDQPIDEKVVKKVVDLVTSHFPSTAISLFDLTHWFVTQIDDGIHHFAHDMPQDPVVIEPSAFWSNPVPIYKITFTILDLAVMNGIYDLLLQADLPGVSVQKSSNVFLDITNQQAQKSAGVRYILEQEALDPSQTAAFGDGPNDLPMLKMVGLPIVMANALPSVKKGAKYMTADHDDDGVGRGIEKFVLPR